MGYFAFAEAAFGADDEFDVGKCLGRREDLLAARLEQQTCRFCVLRQKCIERERGVNGWNIEATALFGGVYRDLFEVTKFVFKPVRLESHFAVFGK